MKRPVSFLLLIFFAGIIVAAFVSYAAIKESRRNKEIGALIASLEQEKEKIRKENDSLQERIAYLDTAQFQERVAKEKLNMQNPDEKVAIIKQGIPEQSSQENDEEQNRPQVEQKANYVKWYDHFFSY